MLALDQYYTNGLMMYFRYVPEKINVNGTLLNH